MARFLMVLEIPEQAMGLSPTSAASLVSQMVASECGEGITLTRTTLSDERLKGAIDANDERIRMI